MKFKDCELFDCNAGFRAEKYHSKKQFCSSECATKNNHRIKMIQRHIESGKNIVEIKQVLKTWRNDMFMHYYQIARVGIHDIKQIIYISPIADADKIQSEEQLMKTATHKLPPHWILPKGLTLKEYNETVGK